MMNDKQNNLSVTDIGWFEAIKVLQELLQRAQVCRVMEQARDEYGFHYNGNLDGILFRYLKPLRERKSQLLSDIRDSLKAEACP